MLVLPNIDLVDGKVVRLAQGRYDHQTVYSDDPSAIARTFAQAGATWIHMVDLDAAKSGKPSNSGSVQAVRKAVSAKIQLGGGARNETIIRDMLAAGVDRVIVGSAALSDWQWFEHLLSDTQLACHLALSLDVRGGKLAIHGWKKQLDTTPMELAKRVANSSLAAIVHTDIARDGMLTGINIEETEKLVSATDIPIIAAGGVRSVSDVCRCRQIGCGGVVVGKAYYEGKVDLAEAIAEAGDQSE